VTHVSEELPDFDPSDPTYVYRRLADDIAKRIERGDLRPASRLPGERDLAQQYGVALGTARRAIKELRDRKLVITLPAKGTYVRKPKESDPGASGPASR
jgi:GntR family transcriptional regulator